MQVYISWSGQTSYKVALLLRDLVRNILPGLDIWISAEDISDGDRWSRDFLNILNETDFCIVCTDPANHFSPWLIFELGAIAKSFEKWSIRLFLFELKAIDLRGPFTEFQPVLLDQKDIMRLLEDLQANFPQIKVSRSELIRKLEAFWADFYDDVAQINREPAIADTGSLDPAINPAEEQSGLEYVDEIDEKILALISVNEGIEDDRIATTVYLTRGMTLKHLIELEGKGLVRSNLSFGIRRWFITDKGKKYLPGVYQG